MADKSLAWVARHRIGIALSRRLLAALGACRQQPNSTSLPKDLESAEHNYLGQQSSSRSPIATAEPLHRTCGNEAPGLHQSLKGHGFRFYSYLGDTVPPCWPPKLGARAGGSCWMSAGNEKPEAILTEPGELSELLNDPIRRRSWLLAKALEHHPLDQALEVARTAEAFITGAPRSETAVRSAYPLVSPPGVSLEPRPPKRSAGLALPPEVREQLLQRLSEGARNAELAAQFGLSMQQVQGMRMGSAREIARRRNRATETEQ
jgi:hypothetical protein